MTTEIIRVMGVVGSARKHGNTHALVDAVLAGAKSAGAETSKRVLSDLQIHPCSGCDYCRQSGECIHDDDMEGMLDLMKASQVWVFGTPVYWWGPTAQMKTFMDRWYQDNDEFMKLSGRKVILVIPFGDDDPETAHNTVGIFQESMKYLKKTIVEIILAPGVNDLHDIDKHPELLQKAFDAGKAAVVS